jgi:Domain of unknown function (DUF4279)
MSSGRGYEYDDFYGTCVETFATLRIFPGETHPDEVTARLGIEPGRVTTRDIPKPYPQYVNGWFLCSDDDIDSRDPARHIDWLLDRIEASSAALQKLQAEGARCDVFAYFVGIGHGGPGLYPSQMRRLADLGLDISWDIYNPRSLHWERSQHGCTAEEATGGRASAQLTGSVYLT